LVYKLVEDPPFLRRFKRGEMRLDYVGLGLLVLGVSALQIFLDKGQEDDWLGSRFIVTLIATSIICLGALVVWEWGHKQPLIDIKLFRNINFASTTIIMFMAGVVAFSSTVLMPQFLQALMGYTAEQAGLVVSAGAALLLLTMPLVGALINKVQAKYLIAFGWLLSAVGLYISTRLLSLGINFKAACIIMLMQYAPLGFIFVPTITASYFGIPQNRSDSVSGLTNFMRNIGSSVGASIVTTILSRRQQFHIARLSEHMGPTSPALAGSFQAMSAYAHRTGAGNLQVQGLSLGMIYRSLLMQAGTLSYLDTYIALATGASAMFLVSFLLQSNNPKHPAPAVSH